MGYLWRTKNSKLARGPLQLFKRRPRKKNRIKFLEIFKPMGWASLPVAKAHHNFQFILSYEPIFIAGPLLTYFGIDHRLESCVSQALLRFFWSPYFDTKVKKILLAITRDVISINS